MIKKFIRRVLRLGSGPGPRTVPKEQHGIGRQAISQGSRKVCEVLHSHGHEAYVVGGAVRDNKRVNAFIASVTALGRPGLPDDIGPAVAALLSEDNRWINAQRIEVSGGMFV